MDLTQFNQASCHAHTTSRLLIVNQEVNKCGLFTVLQIVQLFASILDLLVKAHPIPGIFEFSKELLKRQSVFSSIKEFFNGLDSSFLSGNLVIKLREKGCCKLNHSEEFLQFLNITLVFKASLQDLIFLSILRVS